MEISFAVGQMYTLEQIKPVVPKMKTVVSYRIEIGLVHLYRERDSQNYWVGGPFKGPDSNYFLFLGPQKTKGTLMKELGASLRTSFFEVGLGRCPRRQYRRRHFSALFRLASQVESLTKTMVERSISHASETQQKS